MYCEKIFVAQVALILFFLSTGAVTGKKEGDKPKKHRTKDEFEFDEYGVKYASQCEVCKITALELEAKLVETGKNAEVLRTSYHIDNAKDLKLKEYKKSQVRLIESMETACEGIMSYNIHKERKDSTRFAKGQSQTFQTLHGLVAKGVKVDLGMPFEMWDKPSAEVTDLKTKCDNLIEKYEEEIEDWYNEGEKVPLTQYLCHDVVLKGRDTECLSEKVEESSTADKKPAKGEL